MSGMSDFLADAEPVSPPESLAPALAGLGIELVPERLVQMGAFLGLLRAAQRRFNLTAITDPEGLWHRHVVDSLTLLPGLEDLEAGGRLVDVGAGAGLPGLPLAIARPDLAVTLVEATGKKARFLEAVVAALGLSNVRVVAERSETVARDRGHRERYEVACCRALAPMNVLLELALPLVAVGGTLMAMKGPKAEAELREAGDALAALGAGQVQVFEAYPPETGWEAVIVLVVKARPTPREYPRRPGEPKRAPL